VRSGLKVLETMLEADRTAVCGPRYAHLADRQASRAGTVTSEVVLGGRKVAVRRPRVRADRAGVPATMRSRGTSKSAVSRRFVAKTAAQLAAWQTASLETLESAFVLGQRYTYAGLALG
jgi:hypothetical protein